MQKILLRITFGVAAALITAAGFAQIKWSPNFQTALSQAKATNKLVMIEFYTTWDTNGQHLEADTFTVKGAQAVANKMVPVRLNVEKEGAELGKKFHIVNYPTVLFIDKNQNVVGIIDGYETADEFVKHGNSFIKDYADFPVYESKYNSNPQNLDAITHLGVIYANRYQIAPALTKLAEAEKIDPHNSSDKLSDLYNYIADYYQNRSQYEPAIKYFKRTAATSKSTDKRAYGYLSIAACYFSMDTPADPSAVDAKLIQKVRAHFAEAKQYVEAALKLPNLKPDDKRIAQDDLTQIQRVLKNTGEGGVEPGSN